MKEHLLILVGLGSVILLMSWLPSVSRRLRISYPVIALLIGFFLYYLEIPLDWPDPFWPDKHVMWMSELIVVISLMTAGLKIPTKKSFDFWKIPLKLVFIAMPLTMIGVYFLGTEFLGLSFSSSILLAAVMAPTDPVLAAEVQLAAPGNQDGKADKSEFALTAEAGLNDGMAFPFTFLAVLIIQAGSWEAFNLTGWIANEFFLKLAIGLVAGYVFAKGVIYLHYILRDYMGIKTYDGLLAFAMAIVIYAATELLHGYGFLAVFIAGLTLKNSDLIKSKYKHKLHDFVDEIERVILVIWITLFGGSIMNGILDIASWKGFCFALILLFVIRPISGLVTLVGHGGSIKKKSVIGFFGIRGIGSLFYISWAFVMIGDYDDKAYLYSVVAIVILTSIVIHGLSAPFVFLQNKKANEENNL